MPTCLFFILAKASFISDVIRPINGAAMNIRIAAVKSVLEYSLSLALANG